MTAAGWLRQPSTILGIGVMLALGTYAAATVLTGNASLAQVAAATVFGAVHLLIDDNTAGLAKAAAAAPTEADRVQELIDELTADRAKQK